MFKLKIVVSEKLDVGRIWFLNFLQFGIQHYVEFEYEFYSQLY